MTELISKQLWTMLIMAASGMCIGILINTFNRLRMSLLKSQKVQKGDSLAAKIFQKAYIMCFFIPECMIYAYLISEFAFLGQNGKITFTAIGSFFAGLLLWLKYFCGTINPGENNEQKRKKT